MKVLKEDWSREVSDCINSGKSYMRYAREREINYNQLLYWIKRLEQGRFKLRCLEEKQELSHQELELLLDGVFSRTNTRKVSATL